MPNVKEVNFTVSTAASGTFEVRLPGFNEAIAGALFFATNATADDTPVSDKHYCIGWTDGTREMCMTEFSEDAAAAATPYSAQRNDRVISLIDNTGSEVAGFSFSSFLGANNGGSGDDGIELTIDDQAAAAYRCTVVFIGADDVDNILAGWYDDLGTGTSAIGIDFSTDFGVTDFEPDTLFLGTIAESGVSPANRYGNYLSFGMAVNDGAETQACINQGMYPGTGTATCYARVNNNNALHVYRNATYVDLTVTSFDATGFTVMPNVASGSSIFMFLAIKWTGTPGQTLFDMAWPTAGNYAETNPGTYTPGFGLLAAVQGVNTRNTNDASGADAFSTSFVLFDDTTIAAISANNDDDVPDMVCNTAHSDSLSLYAQDGSTSAVIGTFDGFDSAGFDWSLTTRPTVQEIKGFGWTIEEATSDSEAPDVSAPTDVVIDQVTIRLGATTNEAGFAHAVLTNPGDEGLPTPAEIVAGTAPEQLFKLPIQAVIAEAFTLPDYVGPTPGVEYGYCIAVEDAVGNVDAGSVVTGTFTMTTLASQDSVVISTSNYDIPANSILHYGGGAADSGSTTTMVDAGAIDTDDEFNSLILEDRTNSDRVSIDDSFAATDTFTFTAGAGTPDFTGGGQNYAVVADVATSDELIFEGQVSVTGESADIDYTVKYDSTDLCAAIETQTIDATGLPDGNYDVALTVLGVITLNPTGGELKHNNATLLHKTVDFDHNNTDLLHQDLSYDHKA